MSRGTNLQAVAYYDPDGYPPIVNSARLLAQNGFSLDLFCRDTEQYWGVSYPAEVRLHRIKAHAGNSWREYLSFVAEVLRRTEKNASLFIGHDMHGLLPARLLAARYRRPLVYHCHDYAEDSRKLPLGSRIVRAFERRFARTADLVIVPDAERGVVMTKELRLKQPPIVVANAPLEQPAFRSSCLRQTLSKLGFDFEQIVFRQGSLGPYHAIEPTIRSMPMWINPRWGFVVMGKGGYEYINSLKNLTNDLSVSSRFVVLPPVKYDEVAQFTVGAQVGHALYIPVNLNHRAATTASNKIMEYMAAGLPLLVSNRPALKALVEKYGCGLTADESSPESIAGAVNTLLGDPALAQRMGAAGAQAFVREFNYERQFAPALDAIRRLACASST